jgi:hypothetical protein
MIFPGVVNIDRVFGCVPLNVGYLQLGYAKQGTKFAPFHADCDRLFPRPICDLSLLIARSRQPSHLEGFEKRSMPHVEATFACRPSESGAGPYKKPI